MKTFSFLLSYVFFIIGIAPVSIGTINAQTKRDSLIISFNEWRHAEKYSKIISQNIFDTKMSDDEMAGIELWRAGRNLKLSIVFQLSGYVLTSLGYVGYTQLKKDEAKNAVLITFTIAGAGMLVAGICELISGYNKIGKAGILLQHKKFILKTSGTSVSMNF